MIRRRSSLSVLLIVMILVVSVGCSKQPAAPKAGSEGTTYKVGFLAAITGGAAFLGEPERDAIVMVQNQLDEQGGIVGPDGVHHKVEFLIHDTEGSGDVTIPLAKKLIDDEGVVAIVGTTRSPTSMALLPVMQEAEVTMVSMASSGDIVEPVAERKWIFKTAQSNRHTAPWQVKYAKDNGLTKIASFYVNNAYGEDGAKAVKATASSEGVEIVLEETFGASDTDMTAQLTKFNASDAQALVVTAIPPAAAILTKQYREMGLEQPLIQNHGIGMQPFIALAGEGPAEGVIFPMGKLVAVDALDDGDPQKKVLQDFVSGYQASSGNPPSTFAGHAWDAGQLVVKALEQLPEGLSLEEQRIRVRDELEKIKGFAGISGVFNLSPEDHVGMSPDDIVMVRITGGKWEYFPPEKW